MVKVLFRKTENSNLVAVRKKIGLLKENYISSQFDIFNMYDDMFHIYCSHTSGIMTKNSSSIGILTANEIIKERNKSEIGEKQ